jgi:Tfp pilus assembly protein PilN
VRPVNLIPPEDRRGGLAPLRAGALSYMLIGVFAAALIAVVALVLTQNSVTKSENEIAELEVARDEAAQRAEALAPYAEFASLQAQRETTISSLAQSRFDWERVLRELAVVIPPQVSLANIEASSAGGDEADPEAGSAPSLTMLGCAPDHTAVATFVAALEDIDGVTRVALDNSIAAESEAPGANGAVECDPKATTFAVRAVFDGVAPLAALADPAAPPATTPEAPAAPASEDNSLEEQTEEARKATNLVPGAAR